MSNDREVEVKVTSNADGIKTGMAEAGRSVEGFAGTTRGALAGVAEQFAKIRLLIVGAMAAVGAAALAAAKGAVDFQDEVSKAAQKAGVTTAQFTGMAFAAKLADVGTEELTRTYARLAATLTDAHAGQKQAAELFSRLRLDPKNIRDADALLLALADRFASMNDATARTALAIDVFGERIGPKLVPLLSQGRAGIEALREEAEKLGVVVSTDTGRAAEEFNDTLTRLQAQVQGLQLRMATALLPAVQNVASAFVELGRSSALLTDLAAGARVVFEMLAVVGANVAFVFGGVKREIVAVGQQIGLFAELLVTPPGGLLAKARENWGKWTAISDAVKADGERARAELDAFERRIFGNGGAGRGFVQPAAVGAPAAGPGFVPGAKPADGGKKPEAKSMMATFEAQLDAERQVAAERDALHGLGLQAEAAFWANILATVNLSEADRLAVGRKAAQARVQVLKQEAQEAMQLQGIGVQAWRDSALAAVELDAEAARTRVATGQGTQAELLAQELAFEARRQEIRMAALSASLAVVDPARDPVQVAQLNAQREALEMQHQLALARIRGQIQAQSADESRALWEDATARISGLWDKGVNALMNSTFTWKGALQAVGAEVVGLFSGVVKRMVVSWIFGEQAKTGATAAGTLQRGAMEAAAAAKSVALWAATAFKNIMTSAWEAMAAAYKAIAGIPVVGPFLAPIAAGVAFAGVASIARKVVSAEGGYDIPAGVNPMVQAHQREMILPEKQANVIRDMAEGGGGGQGGITVNISTPDAEGVRRLLLSNSHVVAEAIRKATRHHQLRPGDVR